MLCHFLTDPPPHSGPAGGIIIIIFSSKLSNNKKNLRCADFVWRGDIYEKIKMSKKLLKISFHQNFEFSKSVERLKS